ncbi:MAG: hypothetical protein RML33_10500 [Acidobacteriota bacterium]|nr:hypothetical protein [Acidobacteriota bacterium]
MRKLERYLKELKRIFSSTSDKHEAHYKSAKILVEMSEDRTILGEVLQKHLSNPKNFNTLHYPVVGIDIELNEYFGLVANCWIPLPDRRTDVSTKSIHHHGDMLLTTVTAFGPGYEHWLFETPAIVDASKEIYEMKLIERNIHHLHHVAFVDAYIAHCPFYPPDLTITYALWSSRFPTTWKDKLKRIPILQENSERLRKIGVKLGLTKVLELKVVEYFDFYPCSEGFKGMKERKEFPRTNNEDYLASLFHIIQKTGNENLAPFIKEKLRSSKEITNQSLIEKYLKDLETGKPVEGKLSPEHYNVAHANFTEQQVLNALKL